MKLIAGGKDVSELLEKATWSGEITQVARRLEFMLGFSAHDYYLPKPVVNVGDKVSFYDDDGKLLFFGQIFTRNYSASSNVISFVAFDFLIFIAKSKINNVFEDKSPEAIASAVCDELGVPFGSAASTGITVYLPAFAKTGYETIMAAYTKASLANGKKYMPKMIDNKVCVIEVGAALTGVVLDGDYNIIDATYGESIENMINRVIIADDKNDSVGNVENASDRAAYGTLQDVYKKEEGKDAQAAAKGMLKPLEQTANLTAVSDTRCVTGYAVGVREPITKLCGKFYITSDSHTFQNGVSEMSLGLSYVNIMDEKEIGDDKR